MKELTVFLVIQILFSTFIFGLFIYLIYGKPEQDEKRIMPILLVIVILLSQVVLYKKHVEADRFSNQMTFVPVSENVNLVYRKTVKIEQIIILPPDSKVPPEHSVIADPSGILFIRNRFSKPFFRSR